MTILSYQKSVDVCSAINEISALKEKIKTDQEKLDNLTKQFQSSNIDDLLKGCVIRTVPGGAAIYYNDDMFYFETYSKELKDIIDNLSMEQKEFARFYVSSGEELWFNYYKLLTFSCRNIKTFCQKYKVTLA